jgi:phosphate transport system substrate-binding protein
MSNRNILQAVRHLKQACFPGAIRLAWLCLFLVCLGCSGLSGCGRGQDSPDTAKAITIAGSTSVQPFAEKLAEEYMRGHSEVRIDIQGGGSSAGIYAAQQGVADLGASSRELVKAEKELLEIPIAFDGIAVIANKQNSIENLSLEQIRRIYQGKITDWGELGLAPHPIHLITREEGSGTRNAFEELVMGKQADITPAALVQDSNGSVREIVANDPHALGYISMGLIEPRVRAVAVDGVLPTRENVKDHTYKLVRRFLLVTFDLKPGPCHNFVNFILSPEGQSLLEAEGLVGVVD